MKVVVSLTSTPPRFQYLGPVLEALARQACHEVWLNVPRKYGRWPDWDGTTGVPEPMDPKIHVNRDCEDFGPATKFIGPALHLGPEDLIVYVDDDTIYDDRLVTNLLKWHRLDPASAWGLSGFNFEQYFQGKYPRQHGQPVDVLEGYGAVLVRAGWIQQALPEFKELLEVTWHDDMILCNLLEKAGIKRKTVYVPEANVGQSVRQLQYGFEGDALHHVAGGSHQTNNLKILRNFEAKGKLYYNYKCS
jgi:hypothetical protein